MKDPEHSEPYVVSLRAQQAALTRPKTFIQHINTSDEVVRVIYITNPAYVFLKTDKGVEYDDAVALDLDWEALAKRNWQVPAITEIDRLRIDRERAFSRLYETTPKPDRKALST